MLDLIITILNAIIYTVGLIFIALLAWANTDLKRIWNESKTKANKSHDKQGL